MERIPGCVGFDVVALYYFVFQRWQSLNKSISMRSYLTTRLNIGSESRAWEQVLWEPLTALGFYTDKRKPIAALRILAHQNPPQSSYLLIYLLFSKNVASIA